MTKCLIVDVNDDLAYRHSIAERQVPRVTFEPTIDHKSRDQSFMDCAHVSNGVPGDTSRPSHLNLFVDAGHCSSGNACQWNCIARRTSPEVDRMALLAANRHMPLGRVRFDPSRTADVSTVCRLCRCVVFDCRFDGWRRGQNQSVAVASQPQLAHRCRRTKAGGRRVVSDKVEA
jgi:hypothetical protein